ncbi:MAG: hypothetical protein ACRDHZ_05070 [Ktedonobacteraceae bacterium]
MSNWADDALGKLKKQQGDQRVKDAKFLEKQRLKKAHGGRLWEEVRRAVKENCNHLNTKAEKEILVFEVTQNTILRVRASLDSNSRLLAAAFDEETGLLSWESNAANGQWELAVTDDDGGVGFCRGMRIPSTPASIAKQMLDALLFG